MALLATTLLAACSKVPDGILSEKKMQGVLTDMLLAEAMVNVDYNTYKSDTMKLALYESVFRKHDITQAVYDSSARGSFHLSFTVLVRYRSHGSI